MPNETLRVLIAEDSEEVAEVISRFLSELRRSFPKLTINSVTSLEEVLECLRNHPPDLLTLDLRLADATSDMTLACLPQMVERCAVVIVSGKNLDAYAEMLKALQVPVIKKGQSWMSDNTLLRSCVAALTRRAEVHPTLATDERMQVRLQKMRDLLAELYAPPSLSDAQGTA